MGLPGAVVPPASSACFLNIKASSHLTDAQLFLSTLLSPGACLSQLKGTGQPFRCPSGDPLTSEGPGQTEAAHMGDPGTPTRGRWGCRHGVLPGTAAVQSEGGSAWLRVVGNELLVMAGLPPSASQKFPTGFHGASILLFTNTHSPTGTQHTFVRTSEATGEAGGPGLDTGTRECALMHSGLVDKWELNSESWAPATFSLTLPTPGAGLGNKSARRRGDIEVQPSSLPKGDPWAEFLGVGT